MCISRDGFGWVCGDGLLGHCIGMFVGVYLSLYGCGIRRVFVGVHVSFVKKSQEASQTKIVKFNQHGVTRNQGKQAGCPAN